MKTCAVVVAKHVTFRACAQGDHSNRTGGVFHRNGERGMTIPLACGTNEAQLFALP